jgi:hypothetical protein
MRLLQTFALVILLASLWGCAREEELPEARSYPIIRTLEIISDTIGVTAKGEIAKIGKEAVTEYGFEYTYVSGSKQHTVRKVVGTSSYTGNYEAALSSDLLKGYTYKVHAYAKHGQNTTYGDGLAFTSKSSTDPVIEHFSPKAAHDQSLVTIYGKNFSGDPSLVKVTIGTAQAQVISASRDSVVIRTPTVAYRGSFPLTLSVVEKKTTAAKPFEILGPYISHLSAYRGVPGDELTLYGDYFLHSSRWGINVYIGGKLVQIVSRTEKEIKVIVPAGTPDIFDKPLTVSINGWDKTVSLPYAFTLESHMKPASGLPSSIWATQTGMPSFVADGKAFFFAYDRILSYTMATDTWKNEGTFPGLYRSSSIFERVGDKAYLIGGRYGNVYYGDVWEYDYRQNSWTRLKSLPFALYNATSFVLNGKIHFFGGQNSNSIVKLWQYDPASESLNELNRFPTTSSGGSSFMSGGSVYVLLNFSLWKYNAQEDSWTEKSTLPYQSSFTGTRAYHFQDEGYAINLKDSYAIHRYDAEQDKWILAANYPGCVSNASFYGFSTDARLYIGSYGSSCSTLYYYESR